MPLLVRQHLSAGQRLGGRRRGTAPSSSLKKKILILAAAAAAAVLLVAAFTVFGSTNVSLKGSRSSNNNAAATTRSTTPVVLPPLTTTPLRVFGPSSSNKEQQKLLQQGKDPQTVSFAFYTEQQQEAYLKKYGKTCYSDAGDGDIVDKFQRLPAEYSVQLWKYCVLYLGHGNVYLEPDNVAILQSLETLFFSHQNVAASDSDGLAHSAILKIAQPKANVAEEMMKNIMQHDFTSKTQTVDAFLLQKWLFQAIVTVSVKSKTEDWTMWSTSCRKLAKSEGNHVNVVLELPVKQTIKQRLLQYSQHNNKAGITKTEVLPPTYGKTPSCPVWGGYCCQVVDKEGIPTMLLRHPGYSSTDHSVEGSSSSSSSGTLPVPYADHISGKAASQQLAQELAYISTIRQERTRKQPLASPSFFDILLQNDCLDTTPVCYKCLKSTKTGSCDVCKEACPCFCNALCKIRPPPKPVTKIWHVTPPLYRKDAERLVPRIVHQTWREPVTPEKYPNMSRLIESWKQSGWEYNFYDDDMAAEFLSQHFPPEVRQAYDAIKPGAFKADLFRYCVLLIRGGVYADIDVLLEANLDEAVAPDVGFMTPIDEPGIKVGHRSCLWNGFLAVAPGHVFLAKTIEMVVNNIRNRFTSVDYDDMLCPSPVLSVSHTVDTLFPCGPCILGAGINAVLGRHLQDEFEIGDVDLYKVTDGKAFHPQDPRLKIPGRTVILQQNKRDMGAHRFTWVEKSLIVAATDMPDYDDREKKDHYSKTHEKVGVYGLKKLYKDSARANEEIRIVV